MPKWWQRFLSMPDAQRAEILAKISVWTIIALLYILGGISLYLRQKYLTATPSPTPVQVITITPTEGPTHPEPTETLYPSRTPKPSGTSINGNTTTEWVVLIKRSDFKVEAVI